MGKRVAIKEVASGKVFKTMAEAEREYGIKEGTISWLIGRGEPIEGHMFVKLDEFVEGVSEDLELPYLVPKSAYSDISQDDVVKLLTDKGYIAKIHENVVMVYGINTAQKSNSLREVMIASGYKRSWGWSPLIRDVEETGKPFAYIEQ